MIPLVDAHHHLWDLRANPRYPWLVGPPVAMHYGDYGAIRKDYRVEDFRADSAGSGLVKSIHCEAGWDRGDPEGETRWLQETAEREGLPSGLVVFCEIDAPDVDRRLDAHLVHSRVRGVRQMFFSPADLLRGAAEPAARFDAPEWRRGFARLAERGLAFDLQAPPQAMDAASRLARDFPDTQIVLTHLGLPLDRSPDGQARWLAGMRTLAACPNVAVKISGLPMADRHWTAGSIRPWVTRAVDLFGPGRLMIGSNFPVDGLHASYRELIAAYRAAIADLSIGEQHEVLHGTAERVYRI